MSLIDLLQKGAKASWLPQKLEATPTGEKVFCSTEIEDYSKNGTSYRFVPFVPKHINFCDSNGRDVISYPFSGCIMATYLESGRRKVCHVSTSVDRDADCKNSLKEFLDTNSTTVRDVKLYKPFDVTSPVQENMDPRGCYGLITSDGKCFAITLSSSQSRTVLDLRERPHDCELLGSGSPTIASVLGFPNSPATKTATKAATRL